MVITWSGCKPSDWWQLLSRGSFGGRLPAPPGVRSRKYSKSCHAHCALHNVMVSKFWLKKGGDKVPRFPLFPTKACSIYLRHVVVVKLVIAESHIHVQGEVLSGQDETLHCLAKNWSFYKSAVSTSPPPLHLCPFDIFVQTLRYFASGGKEGNYPL